MASPDLTGQAPADHAQAPTNTPPTPASTHLVLCATALGVLARDIAARLPLNSSSQALAAALDDTAALADTWVEGQLDALAQPLVAPAAAWVAPTPQPAATPPPQPTKSNAVRAATAQLGPGATSPQVAQLVIDQYGLDVTDASVRAVWSKDRKAAPQPEAQPAPQPGTGMYL